MRQILTKLPPKSLLKRVVSYHQHPLPSQFSLSFTTSTETRPEKLDRIANELLSLNAVELHDYSILFRLKMGLKNSAPAGLAGPAQGPGGEAAAAATKKEEKTVFDVKLEKFEAASKIKIIKEVRSFTDLGLKEAKELVEKVPSVIKNGVSKEEAQAIVDKLKAIGATAVFE